MAEVLSSTLSGPIYRNCSRRKINYEGACAQIAQWESAALKRQLSLVQIRLWASGIFSHRNHLIASSNSKISKKIYQKTLVV